MNRLSEPIQGLVLVPIAVHSQLYGDFIISDPEVYMEFEAK